MKDRLPGSVVSDIIQWDVFNWSHCLTMWETSVSHKVPLRCLEVGAREGGLSLWLALKGHTVLCSDLYGPKPKAKRIHEAYGVARRVSYSAIDATRIPYDGHFDVIALKSVLGGIAAAAGLDSAAQAVREIYKALRPGGRFLIAENLRATRVHMFCRRRLQRRNESEWRYFTIEEMRRLLDDFSSVEYSARGFLGTFGRTERQRAILGRIDRLLHPWLPERLKYIFFGVAVK